MASNRDRFYLRSIDRRWRDELRKASERVLVFSPYVTSPLAELVLKCASPKICEVYTTLSVENFAAGASSIKTLKALHDSGYSIFDLDRLHAKVIIVDESFASVGSQNLTRKGKSNLEATIAISDQCEVAAIVEDIRPWLVNRRPVTKQMLADVEEKAMELAERYEILRREASRLEKRVGEAAQRRHRESFAEKARESLREIVHDGSVSESTARDSIARSAWWFRNDTETEIPAPGLARRVKGSEGVWWLKRGNIFIVSRALQRCASTIESYLTDMVSGKACEREELIDRLRLNVRSSVANSKGSEYDAYPVRGPGELQYMMFGNLAINVDHFIRVFLELLPLDISPTSCPF